MAFGSTGGRESGHKGPAAVERVLRVEVRVASEDLSFAIAEQLFRQEAFRQELRDIGFDDLAAVFFPAADFGAADEGASGASESEIGVRSSERERREQLGGACGEEKRRGRGVTGLAGLAEFLQRGLRWEVGGDADVQSVAEGQKGQKGQKGSEVAHGEMRVSLG